MDIRHQIQQIIQHLVAAYLDIRLYPVLGGAPPKAENLGYWC